MVLSQRVKSSETALLVLIRNLGHLHLHVVICHWMRSN